MTKSKICKGILHPKGIKLPIDKFHLCLNNRYSKRRKVYYIYYYYRNTCKDCDYKQSLPFVHKYKKSEKGIITNRKSSSKYQKKLIQVLGDNYIKTLLAQMGVNKNNQNYIILKRKLLILYRTTKTIKHGKNN